MEARHLLKDLKDDGWYLGATEGACRQYIHKAHPYVITVSVRYNDVLGPGTQASVERAAEAEPHPDPQLEVEPTKTGFSAFSPELPGVIATGATEAEARDRQTQAVELHLQAVRQRAGRSG